GVARVPVELIDRPGRGRRPAAMRELVGSILLTGSTQLCGEALALSNEVPERGLVKHVERVRVVCHPGHRSRRVRASLQRQPNNRIAPRTAMNHRAIVEMQ